MVFPKETTWNIRLRMVRAMKGATQQAVADEVGTSRKQIYNWESGKTVPSAYSQKRLAHWAETPATILFKGAKE